MLHTGAEEKFPREDGIDRDFPGGPVVGTSPSSAEGAKIPHAARPKNQNIKQKQYCKFNKNF